MNNFDAGRPISNVQFLVSSFQFPVLPFPPVNQLLPLRIISNQRDLPDSKLDPPLKFQTSRSGRAGLCIGADFPFANEDNRDVVRARRQHPYGQALQYPALGEGHWLDRSPGGAWFTGYCLGGENTTNSDKFMIISSFPGITWVLL